MSQILTVGSLFTGIGGIDLGLEQTGRFHIEWQVENDSYCQKVLTKHWPNVARYGDVRTVGRYNLSSVDLLCGGFPCQDISNAGKRQGLAGERSGLWNEYIRIICELRPQYVIVENVAALLYPFKRDGYIEPAPISRVLGDLVSCGYDAEWQMLPAASFGAPHIRERIFIVACSQIPHAYSDRCREWAGQSEYKPKCDIQANAGYDGTQANVANSNIQRLEIRQCFGGNTCEKSQTVERDGLPVSDTDSQRTQISSARVFSTEQLPQCESWWATEPDVGRVAHGVPSRMDRLRGLGNAVVPQVAYYVGLCIAAWHDNQMIDTPS